MAEFFYTTKLIQHVLMNRRRKRVSFVLSKVDTIPGRLVLDIGCGRNGRSFEDFVSRDLKIVGFDILDEDKINMNHPDFTYFKQNAENLNRFKDAAG